MRREATTIKGEYRDHACMGMIEPNGWDLNEVKGQRREIKAFLVILEAKRRGSSEVFIPQGSRRRQCPHPIAHYIVMVPESRPFTGT